MKKELNEKKLYMEPQIMVITLNCQYILAGSNDGDGNDGGNNGNDGDDDNGLGDSYWHEGLI